MYYIHYLIQLIILYTEYSVSILQFWTLNFTTDLNLFIIWDRLLLIWGH